MALSPGTHLGPYEILEQIGAGGMGAVYKARDGRLGREVAIKVLPPEKMADPDRKRRFIQEARSASALNHPHIVTIHDIGETGGIDYIVMELVDGRTLDQLVSRDGMKPSDALKYAIPVAEALASAHAAGIVHRDLKPSNVIVSRSGVVKVLDFGLAKLTYSEAPAGDNTRTMADLSQEGAIVGTAAYMSPEQAEGHPVDARSDIFSFGTMLYEMLTGKRAFTGKTTVSTLAAVLRHEPTPARELAPRTPVELERIVRRCLRKEPDRRFQTAADLKVALLDVQDDVQSGRVDAVPATHAHQRKLWPMAIGLAALALVLGAVAAWSVRGRSAPPVHNYTFRRLTNDTGLTRTPALSPDGKLVAYESDRAGTGVTDIWVQQVTGGSAIRLTDCKANCMQPSFSPDGSNIVYYSREGGGGIYLIPTLGGEPRRIASALSYAGARPRFSPDGSKIAFRYLQEFRTGAISVIDTTGSPIHQFLSLPSENNFLWSPDSRGVLLMAHFGDAYPWVIYPVDGGQPVPTELRAALFQTFGPHSSDLESWSRDRVILTIWDSFHGSLVELPVSGAAAKLAGTPRSLTQGSGSESEASVSGDGRHIAFSAYGNDNAGIWRIPMDAASGKPASPPVQVTQPPRSYIMPSPAAHAPVLAYVSQDGLLPVLWIRDLTSGKERRIAERAAWPAVSPDGRKLVYQQFAIGRSEIGRGPLYETNTEGDPAPRKVCDVCGEPYHFFAHDSKVLFDHADSKSHEIHSIDLASGVQHLVLKDAKHSIFVPHLSPDEKWISFTMITGDRGRRLYVAPFEPDKEIPESAWILVLDGHDIERQPFWSPVGDVLYFLSDKDGFRCIWGLRLDRVTRKPSGDAFPVQHFHDSQYTLLPFSNPGYIGLSVTSDALYLSLNESRANVWLAEEVEGKR